MLVFRVGDFTHPQVWEVAESEGVADEDRIYGLKRKSVTNRWHKGEYTYLFESIWTIFFIYIY